MSKVFLAGATGYIGGHTLQLITNKHPEWDITALVRTEFQAKILKKQIPSILAVPGSLEDLDLVARLAAEADVVLQNASVRYLSTMI
ncbi:hypothetical protein IFR04_006498 [Cadophora malorum]|uniref:NAD(P)-binding domain-containing protein n=1 Tax=Cadophora malorum TaxID=108018 RepID=A0A8H7W7G8_9HELO|nr:hypothetical protein IFR04_006498 [Cadophora malorum]